VLRRDGRQPPDPRETWQGGAASAHTWQNYIIGERITVGLLPSVIKPGIELTIAGNPINQELIDIWTLDDLRQLRDDLSDLLADERLVSAARTAAVPIRVERPADMPDPCTEYHVGDIFIEVLDSPQPGNDGLSVWRMGGDYIPLARAEQHARDLLTLLADPRVKAAIEARRGA
jgi:hypothetical protein